LIKAKEKVFEVLLVNDKNFKIEEDGSVSLDYKTKET
jgi:hypothetical protein